MPRKVTNNIGNYIKKNMITDSNNCWNWAGAKVGRGYGKASYNWKTWRAHRLSYYYFYKDIDPLVPGLTLDHLCKNRLCVNPTHLEQVTVKENNLRGDTCSGINSRKTHCKRGHEFTEKNTRKYRGHRSCKLCSAILYAKRNGQISTVHQAVRIATDY